MTVHHETPTPVSAEELHVFQRSIVRVARALIALGADARITPTMVHTIRAIDNLTGPERRLLSMGELSDYLGITAPSLTRTIGAMEKLDLVRRDPHPDDGRRTVVALTANGIGLIERVLALRREWLLERFATLSPADIATIMAATEALERMIEGVDVPKI